MTAPRGDGTVAVARGGPRRGGRPERPQAGPGHSAIAVKSTQGSQKGCIAQVRSANASPQGALSPCASCAAEIARAFSSRQDGSAGRDSDVSDRNVFDILGIVLNAFSSEESY